MVQIKSGPHFKRASAVWADIDLHHERFNQSWLVKGYIHHPLRKSWPA